MSIVNQVEKDGILYDINDARVYTVDLGTLTLTPDDPNNPKSFSGNTTLTAEQFLSLQNSEIGFIKFTFNGTNIITTVNENLEHSGVTGIVTASTTMMMSGSFSAISVLAQYEGTIGETVPTQVIVVLDILSDSANGAKIVDFGTVDGNISDPDNPYTATITQEQYEEALEADIAQFTTTSDGGITFRALKMQLMPEQAGVLFTAVESELRGLMVMVAEQNGSYTLMIGMSSRLLTTDDNINIENCSSPGASEGQVPTADGNGGISWADPASVTSYDDLTGIPIINQDLDEVGFTPVTQTYYRHVGMSATNFNIGKIYYYDGTGYNVIDGSSSGGSSDIIIDIGNVSLSTERDVINSFSAEQKAQVIDTTVDNVYIKVKDTFENANLVLKRAKYKIIDPDDNPNYENTEVCFVSGTVSDDFNRYDQRYVLYYTIDYSDYPNSTTYKALLYKTTLGAISWISLDNSSWKAPSTLAFGSDFTYDFNTSKIKLSSSYTLSGTISSGDTISDTTAIDVMAAHKPIIINGLQLYYTGIFNSQIQYTSRIMNTTYSLGNGKDFCDTKVYLFNPSTNKIIIVEPHVWRHCFDIDFDNNSGIAGHFNIEIISNSADFTDAGWETGRVLATLLYQSNLNSYDHLASSVTGYFSGDTKTILGLYSWDSNEVSVKYYDPAVQTTSTFSLYKRNGSSPYDYITASSYYANKIY